MFEKTFQQTSHKFLTIIEQTTKKGLSPIGEIVREKDIHFIQKMCSDGSYFINHFANGYYAPYEQKLSRGKVLI